VAAAAADAAAGRRGVRGLGPVRDLGRPLGLPVEELLFFVVVPTCAVLAFEAVRRVKGWPGGDE
jgi:hypothetical protein